MFFLIKIHSKVISEILGRQKIYLLYSIYCSLHLFQTHGEQALIAHDKSLVGFISLIYNQRLISSTNIFQKVKNLLCNLEIINTIILFLQAGKLTVINSLIIYLKSMYSKPTLALFLCIMLTIYTCIRTFYILMGKCC